MYLVVGLGITGKSVIRFLKDQGELCLAFDTRKEFDLSELQTQYPSLKFACGQLPSNWISQVTTVVLSPGIGLAEPWLEPFKLAQIPIIGDIELFARAVGKPVVAITGSNGKSTVTTLVAQVLSQAGYQTGMGGNIGEPALNLLASDKNFDVFVLELSSFQLETTYSLQPISATVLNVSEDHMDRYEGLEDYLQAKMTILNNAEWSVLPVELVANPSTDVSKALSFGIVELTAAHESLDETQYGVIQRDNEEWLGFGQTPLLRTSDMALQGEHHQLNALATLALCRPFKVSSSDFTTVFSSFKGLPHRTQLIAESQGIQWINDSKGTNVGATITAIKSFAKQTQGQILLLAGGVGKDADFTPLAKVIEEHCRAVILFGRDSQAMAESIQSEVSEKKIYRVENVKQAIEKADRLAQSSDIVLFSPACASFDQFTNYVQRGETFERLVIECIGKK